jgi:hypothetical protein
MRTLIIIAILVAAVATVFAVEGAVEYLRARSTGSSVILDWQSGEEGSLKSFEVERASEDNIFRYVATVQAKGSNHTYRYTDDEAFGKGENERISSTYFTYRLKLVHSDNTVTYSTTAGVSHSVSTVKRTWGMIKEMFR